MKYFFSILAFFLVTKSYSQEISLTATYSQAVNNKKITKSNKPKVLKDIEYKILCTLNESRFQLIDKMDSDATKSNSRFVRGAGAVGVFYTNISTKEKLHSFPFLGNNVTIKEDSNKRKWNLTKETKKINKYTCYKAIYNFTSAQYPEISIPIIAWYTPDIPLSFGPIGYGGLPGLILELNYLDYIFIVKKIKIDKGYTQKIKKPKGKIFTKKQFAEFVKKKTGYDLKKELKKQIKTEKNKN